MDTWNSQKYLQFAAERSQPAIDLASRVFNRDAKLILDVGCGPGNSTYVLKRKFPDAHIIGIDSSQEMITRAKQDYPQLSFLHLDVSADLSELPLDFDLVFSNACLQWVPEHERIFKKLFRLLKSGGELAIQLPYNQQEPIETVVSDLLFRAPWNTLLMPTKFYHENISYYYKLLSALSKNFRLWKTTYIHELESHQSILDWYKGTALKDYYTDLTAELQKRLDAELLDGICKGYQAEYNKKVLFDFPRLFLHAVKE